MTFLTIDHIEIAKWLAVALYVAATAGVWLGVYWEGEKFDENRKNLGWLLLVWSLGSEVFLGTAIFALDGLIAQIQRYEIASLIDAGNRQQSKLSETERALFDEVERNTLRGLTKEQFDSILSLRGQIDGIRIFWSPTLDAFNFATEIGLAFRTAEIKVESPNAAIPLTNKTPGDAPRDLWVVGNSLYVPPGFPTLLGETLGRVNLMNGGGAMPDFAAKWEPKLPILIVGVRSMIPTHPSYFVPGTWDITGKFHPAH